MADDTSCQIPFQMGLNTLVNPTGNMMACHAESQQAVRWFASPLARTHLELRFNALSLGRVEAVVSMLWCLELSTVTDGF